MNDNDIELLLEFANHIEGQRHDKDPLIINDRDRWFVTMIFGILSDPHHRLNKTMMKDLIRVYMERGGKIPRKGQLANRIREKDQSEHIAQYLYDRGFTHEEIANVIGCSAQVVSLRLKYLREEDYGKEMSDE